MTTWVFLRGLTREARHWGDFPERFRAAFKDEAAAMEIVCPDLPGNGKRWRETSPTGVDEIMEACRRDLREQGVMPPYLLLALSLGGMVALAWASRYPVECERLVLLSTSLRPFSPVYERLRPTAWLILLKMLFAGVPARERAILKLTSARAREKADLLPDWIAWARQSPVLRRNAMRQLLAAARFRADRKPGVPLLLLAGLGDQMVSPRCSQRLAQAWDIDLVLHPDAGHDLPLDAGDWVAQAIKTWLKRAGPCH